MTQKRSGEVRETTRELTVTQLNVIDNLVLGKNDRQTAERFGIQRHTVTRWRLYDPIFRAALHERRAEIWSGAMDRLRLLIPKAIDFLEAKITAACPDFGLQSATAVLRLVKARDVIPVEPTDPKVVFQLTMEEAPPPRPAPREELNDKQEEPSLSDDEEYAELLKKMEALMPTEELPASA